MAKILVILALLCIPVQIIAQSSAGILQLKLTDTNHQPIFGVYVILPGTNTLLATSDIDGECRINIPSLSDTDTLQFQGMGYITRKLTVRTLKQQPLVCLQALAFDLDEAQAKGIRMGEILKRAAEKLKKQKVSRNPLCRYYGPAQYEKTTVCHDTAVEYRREYGYYFTSGDVLPSGNWDKTFRSYMVPRYMARSYSFSSNGDTLTPKYMTSGEIRFDIGTRKIFTLCRAIQLFAPLYTDPKYYEIQPLDNDSPDYLFSFRTKPQYYPGKIRISCKGTFIIDRENLYLKKMDFDYIDYQLLRQVLLTDQRKTTSPFSTRASLTFVYDSSGIHYIHSCRQTTTWKYDLGNHFILIEQPSRDLPGFHRLVEEEAFCCYNLQKIPVPLQTPKVLTQIHMAQRYPVGNYDPVVFSRLPYLLDFRKVQEDLGKYMKLEDQFRTNNNKAYYPKNYLSGSDIDRKERAIYLKDLHKTREHLFEMFGEVCLPAR